MQYVVLGCGAIGGTVAAGLARDGHDVLVADTDPAVVRAVNAAGLRIEGPVERFTAYPRAVTTDDLPERLRGPVLLAVKAHHVPAAASLLAGRLQPFSLYEGGPAEGRAKDMAAAYGLPYVIRQEAGPDRAVSGTTVGAAAQIGIPAICAESGGCGLVEPHAVALHEAGLNNVLRLLDMTDDQPGETDLPELHYPNRFLWLRCRQAGWWEPVVGPGDTVASGQVIGTFTSLDGADTLETITAPADCVVIFLTSSPAVADDGLLIGLGAS